MFQCMLTVLSVELKLMYLQTPAKVIIIQLARIHNQMKELNIHNQMEEHNIHNQMEELNIHNQMEEHNIHNQMLELKK